MSCVCQLLHPGGGCSHSNCDDTEVYGRLTPGLEKYIAEVVWSEPNIAHTGNLHVPPPRKPAHQSVGRLSQPHHQKETQNTCLPTLCSPFEHTHGRRIGDRKQRPKREQRTVSIQQGGPDLATSLPLAAALPAGPGGLEAGESQSKPGIKMVYPEPCKELRRRPQLFLAGTAPY